MQTLTDASLAELAKQIGAVPLQGHSSQAHLAIHQIFGEDNQRFLVDYYVDEGLYAEFARVILWMLRAPGAAMEYCYQIYKTSRDQERRISAVELLRVLADERAYPWIEEFLSDPDQAIQNWGAGVLDQMVWGGGIMPGSEVPPQVEHLLQLCKSHANPGVRERAQVVQQTIDNRQVSHAPG